MYSRVATATIRGIQSVPVCVEADVSDGMPVFEMVGFLASEVKEARERVRTALRNVGCALPPRRITVNFMPADIRKSGAGFDLPIAVAVLAAMGRLPHAVLDDVLIVGEIGLNGVVQPVHGVLPMVAEAKERGIRRCIVPRANRKEAALVSGMLVCGVENIGEVMRLLEDASWEKYAAEEYNIEETQPAVLPDFSEIHGQRLMKRACEVAVTGMHNLLFVGPPGAGKTMVASRIPSILPPLAEAERMELSKIYSVKGMLSGENGLLTQRPFRAPHHTVSVQGLTGGGRIPQPGEISLAHKGVLFLDELPEFARETVEALRQPLEEGAVHLVRLGGSYVYPADFMLVAAMNPCPCGYYPDMQKCRCTQTAIHRYLERISQPILDRIDICVEAPALTFGELTGQQKEETSAAIQKRVAVAQDIQRERYRKEGFSYNSQIPATKIREYCALDKKQEQYMVRSTESCSLPPDLTISFCGWRARWRIWTAAVGFATGIWRRQSATEALTESSGRGEEMNYAYWFANIPGLSNCAKISIHEKVGNAQDIYFLSEKQMENMQLLAKEIQAVRAAQKTDMEEAYAKMCESGISFVSLEDASYPKRLRHIANPPYGLYVKGCLPQGETVAIVGARMCSEYGRTVARELGRMLAARGVGVVSGMARGIDAAGHQGALDVGGISCAVLGCGVDVCYPKSSRALYEEILERGSVVSEYPPGTQPIPGYFPQRNRIISGLVRAVVVVEAKQRSGSLITADFALEQGRDVYAIPGRITDALSAGCNSLIRQGAGAVSDLESFVQELAPDPGAGGETCTFEKLLLEKEERLVYSCVDLRPKSMEELLEETDLSVPELAQILGILLKKGFVTEAFKNCYIRRI